ncbi:MAG: putative transporter [Capsulimonadaceae bacterium]|nr:putative transporter [Capsulimonadaceae bacterium]
MHWLVDLLLHPSAAQASAHTLLILALIVSLGVMFGSLRVAGISLGVAGALFVGLFFGHFGLSGDHAVLEFAQSLGLVLFVYTIGIQVGPGFIASLRSQGLKLNLLTAAIVVFGVIGTILLGRFCLPHKEFSAMVGVFCGATTSTPSLAATRQAVMAIAAPGDLHALDQPVLGYAVAYPFGVIGIILSMFIIRWVFRVNLKKEGEQLASETNAGAPAIETINVEVTNQNLDGMALSEIVSMQPNDIVVSRVMKEGETLVATEQTVVAQGDVLLAVGAPDALDTFRRIVGSESKLDLKDIPSDISPRQILVSRKEIVGKTIPDLKLSSRFGVTASRVSRGDIELTATDAVKLQFGDVVTVVGEEDKLNAVAKEFGDSVKQRDKPMIVPMFVGIIIGVFVGSIPVQLPGFPAPVTLGLAGGPLITAIILSLIGKVGPLVWYMPRSANLMLREIGIVLFLSCVGLNAGSEFIPALTSGHGFVWMGYGALITVIPLLGVAIFARAGMKINYMPLCGLMAGSMTDTAALTFALQATGSEAPSLAYATVYPMAVLLRVLAVQAMILFFR